MSKFKIGDKVKIVKPWHIDLKYLDNIVTICEIEHDGSICSRYHVLENNRPWVDSELELMNDNNIKTTEITVDTHGMTIAPFDPTTAVINSGSNESEEKIENKEENEMRNEVLELWYERQMKNIEKKYDKYVEEYIEKNYSFVNDYKQLIKDFEDNLEYLYTLNNKDELFILKENTSCNVFKYVIDNEKLLYKANEYFEKDKKEDIELIKKTYAEISALLSMSSDLEYQQSVLIEYGIIDKKTKRMIANEDSSK